MANDSARQWLTVSEAAQKTGYSEVAVRKLAQNGVIRAEKPQRGVWLVYWPSLEVYIAERGYGPRDKSEEQEIL